MQATRRRLFQEQADWFERMGNLNALRASRQAAQRMTDPPASIWNAAMHPFEWSPWHPWFTWLPRRALDNTWIWGRCERAIRSVEVGPQSFLEVHYRPAP